MKKLLLCLLAFACCFAFAACSDDKKPITPGNGGGTQTEQPGNETPGSGQETELPRVDF